MFVLADGLMHAHLSEMYAGTYKKAHRHAPGFHVMCVMGHGFSFMWFDGDRDFVRVDWHHGVLFPPAHQQFHQHFTTSPRRRALSCEWASEACAIRSRIQTGATKFSGGKDVRYATSLTKGAAIRSNTRIRTRASTRCGSTK